MEYKRFVVVSEEEHIRRNEYMIEAKKKKLTFQQMADHLGIPVAAAEKWYHRHVLCKPMLKPRNCLCCRREFDSEGPHNRLCGKCRHERTVNPWEVITGASRRVGRP